MAGKRELKNDFTYANHNFYHRQLSLFTVTKKMICQVTDIYRNPVCICSTS